MKTEEPDVRVLCQRCWMEYHLANFLMKRTSECNKCECWKCGSYNGYEYIVKQGR